MRLIEIAQNVHINPDEIVSIEHDDLSYEIPSGGYVGSNFNGTRIILKNGRKVFVNRVMPSEIIKKIEDSK